MLGRMRAGGVMEGISGRGWGLRVGWGRYVLFSLVVRERKREPTRLDSTRPLPFSQFASISH